MNEPSINEKPLSRDSISVVVCTYKRADKLPHCLNKLLAMNGADGLRWEIVCVDSNTTSESRQIIEEFARSSPIPIRYVFEPDPRLSLARNAGLRHASGDILAFTDDDCLVDPNWLVTIWKEFRADDSLAILAGRLELHNPDDLPICIRTFRDRIPIGPTSFFSLSGTSNMAFRRRVVDAIGGFDPEFGPGASLLAAEDSDFVYRALKVGLTAIYSPDVLIFHDHGRRTMAERRKVERAYVISRGAFYLKHILTWDSQVMRLAYWESNRLAKQVLLKPDPEEARVDAARLLGYLLKGAFLYLWVQTRRVAGGSSSNHELDLPVKSGRPAVHSR